MPAFEIIAEQRMREAMERGEFDRLPGAGKPLVLEDDTTVPPGLELRKEIVTLRDLVRAVEDDGERTSKARELNRKLLRLGIMSGRPVDLDAFPEHRDRIAGRPAR